MLSYWRECGIIKVKIMKNNKIEDSFSNKELLYIVERIRSDIGRGGKETLTDQNSRILEEIRKVFDLLNEQTERIADRMATQSTRGTNLLYSEYSKMCHENAELKNRINELDARIKHIEEQMQLGFCHGDTKQL